MNNERFKELRRLVWGVNSIKTPKEVYKGKEKPLTKLEGHVTYSNTWTQTKQMKGDHYNEAQSN